MEWSLFKPEYTVIDKMFGEMQTEHVHAQFLGHHLWRGKKRQNQMSQNTFCKIRLPIQWFEFSVRRGTTVLCSFVFPDLHFQRR